MTGVLVVTGGSSGIGLGIAEAALAEGWKVAALDLPGEALDALAARAAPGDLRVWGLDITDEPAVAAALTEIVEAFGPVTGLVNSAGIGRNISFEETSVEDFRRVLDVNVVGAFIVSRECARRMVAGGSIVQISSVNGIQGSRGRIAYGSSKGAVNTMTRIMAVELATRGIRVNAIAPGPVDTPMAVRWHDEATRAEWVGSVPLARYGAVEEIAAVALFLLDPMKAGYVTGQTIAADGGFTIAGLRGA